jgi:hypothetical protein
MAPGFHVAGGSQVLGSVNSGSHHGWHDWCQMFFAGQQIFQDAVLFVVRAVGKSSCRSAGPRALRSKWLDNADLPLPPRLTHSL